MRLSLGSDLKGLGNFVKSDLKIVQFFIGLLIRQSGGCLFARGGLRSFLDVSGDLLKIFVQTYDLVRHLVCQSVQAVHNKSTKYYSKQAYIQAKLKKDFIL